MKKIIALLALALCACAAKTPVVRPVEVQVPVVTQAVPPPELMACGSQPPGFQFYPGPTNPKDVLILEKDQPAFRGWVEDKLRCIRAWQEWVK